MKTRTLSVGQFLGVKLSPRSPTAWKPPAGEAGIELVNRAPAVRELSVVCTHGCLKGTFETHAYVRNLFGSVHPACPVTLAHQLWWPAAAGAVAARGVTATGAAAQAALTRVRGRGQEVEAFLTTHGCVECVPGLSEVSRLDGSGAIALALIHAAGCPAGGGA